MGFLVIINKPIPNKTHQFIHSFSYLHPEKICLSYVNH